MTPSEKQFVDSIQREKAGWQAKYHRQVTANARIMNEHDRLLKAYQELNRKYDVQAVELSAMRSREDANLNRNRTREQKAKA